MDSAKRHYYVSLPFYGHKVFKCAGFGAEKPDHLAFYKPHFERYGGEGTGKDAEAKGPYTVLILDEYVGDKVTADGKPITLGDAIAKYGPSGKVSDRSLKLLAGSKN